MDHLLTKDHWNFHLPVVQPCTYSVKSSLFMMLSHQESNIIIIPCESMAR